MPSSYERKAELKAKYGKLLDELKLKQARRSEPSVRCGVGVVVKMEYKVLVGKRKGSHGEGILAFPGGHIDFTDSSFAQACEREVNEELGMKIKVQKLKGRDDILTTFDILSEDGAKRYVTSYFLADYLSGGTFEGDNVKPREPDKVEGSWFWVTLDELKTLIEKDGRTEQEQWIPISSLLLYREELGL